MNKVYNLPPNITKFKAIATGIVILIIVLAALVGSSIVNISGSSVGIVERKFGGGALPDGKILAVNGENGIQAKVLAPGWHFFYWPWQYKITKEDITVINKGEIGLLQAADGISLPEKTVYAPEWTNPDQMTNAAFFLSDEGKGYKGPQLSVLKPGNYRLNTKLFSVKTVPLIDVKTGNAAVIKSNVGTVSKTKTRLVKNGERGIWKNAKGEGQYYLNTDAYETTLMSIRQVKVSYTAISESGEQRGMQVAAPITVRSIDGFTFPVDVRITYKIDIEHAPKVVATIGNDQAVLNKLVTPTVRAIFRNNAEKVKALAYVMNRSQQESQSSQMLSTELDKYGVTLLAVRIGNVGDEKSLGHLLKTQTDREIALQQQETFQEQQRAAEEEKALTKTTQEATEEKRLATAAYSVKIAEEDKKKMIIDAQAGAEKITLTAKAQAEAYKLVSEVIGSNNAALIEIMKVVASENIRITPEVMVGGTEKNGLSDALMGTILKDRLNVGPVKAVK